MLTVMPQRLWEHRASMCVYAPSQSAGTRRVLQIGGHRGQVLQDKSALARQSRVRGAFQSEGPAPRRGTEA